MNRHMLLVMALLLPACRDKTETAPGTQDSGTPPVSNDSGNSDSGAIQPSEGCTAMENARPLGDDVCVAEAPCRWDGGQSYEYFGYAADAGGDFDGDGRDDFVVGAPLTDISGDESAADAGRVMVVSGAALGADGSGIIGHFQGRSNADYAGTSVRLVDDVNGDGMDDVLIGARGVDTDDLDESGAAYLVFGSTGGTEDTQLDPTVTFVGERSYARVGTTVSGIGDVDGDGLAELLLSGELREYDAEADSESYGIGRAYIVAGQTGSWNEVTSLADADASFDGEGPGQAAGLGLGDGGDFDGDGYADISVAAPYGAAYRGRVYAMPGGTDAIAGPAGLADAPIQLDGAAAYDVFGWALTAGDLDGDGFSELIVGAPMSDDAWPEAGTVTVYSGHADFFAGAPTVLAQFTGEFDDHQLGTGLTARGDIDADGRAELVMGAVNAWQDLVTKGGRVYVVSGKADGWSATPISAGTADIIAFGSHTEDYLGRASALGDFNGDEADDLLIGSGYTNLDTDYDVGSIYLFWGG